MAPSPPPRQSDADRAVAAASAMVERGEWSGADLLLRYVLEDFGGRADAHNLLGRIALAVGRPRVAGACFRAAMAADPYFKPAAKNLRRAESEEKAPAGEGSDACRRERGAAGAAAGYLVIRAWGFGFWSDVDHVLGNLLLAEITGRTPVVMWGSDSLWGGSRDANGWDLYFEPVSGAGVDEAFRAGRVFPPRWTRDALDAPDPAKWQTRGGRSGALTLLNRPEETVVADFVAPVAQMRHWLPESHPMRGAGTLEVYRHLIGRYLRPRPDVRDEIESFCAGMIGRGPTLGVHYRGSDKAREVPDLAELNAGYPVRIDGLISAEPDLRLFVITDSAPALAMFRSRYGARLSAADCRRTADDVGVHYQPGHGDRRRLGLEVMLDAYAAARCDRFLGLAFSNVSCMVRNLKEWPEGACELMGPDLHLKPPLDVWMELARGE